MVDEASELILGEVAEVEETRKASKVVKESDRRGKGKKNPEEGF